MEGAVAVGIQNLERKACLHGWIPWIADGGDDVEIAVAIHISDCEVGLRRECGRIDRADGEGAVAVSE